MEETSAWLCGLFFKIPKLNKFSKKLPSSRESTKAEISEEILQGMYQFVLTDWAASKVLRMALSSFPPLWSLDPVSQPDKKCFKSSSVTLGSRHHTPSERWDYEYFYFQIKVRKKSEKARIWTYETMNTSNVYFLASCFILSHLDHVPCAKLMPFHTFYLHDWYALFFYSYYLPSIRFVIVSTLHHCHPLKQCRKFKWQDDASMN